MNKMHYKAKLTVVYKGCEILNKSNLSSIETTVIRVLATLEVAITITFTCYILTAVHLEHCA